MPKGLTKDSIVAAALAELDAVGIDRLTLRAVAARLNAQAPALYWHVRSKDDLLDEMATEIWRRIVAEVQEHDGAAGWQDDFRAFAVVTRRQFLAHRDGAKVFSGTYMTDQTVLQSQEQQIARMVDQGFAVADIARAWALIYSFTVGFCIEEQSVAQVSATGDERYSLEARERRVDADAHPFAAAVGPEVFGDQAARFADLIDVLIETIGRMRTRA